MYLGSIILVRVVYTYFCINAQRRNNNIFIEHNIMFRTSQLVSARLKYYPNRKVLIMYTKVFDLLYIVKC